MKRLVLIALLLSCFLPNYAQEFAKFRNKKKQNPFINQWFLVYVRFTSTDGKYVDPQTYPSIGFSIRDDSYKKKGLRWRFDHPSLSDLIYLLATDGPALWNNKKAPSSKRTTELTFGSGLIGWHQVYINAISRPRMLVSPGVSFGDYLFASKRVRVNGNPRIYDPAGYYLTLGPSVMVTKGVHKKAWLDLSGAVDISLVKVTDPSTNYKETPGYPKPVFATFAAQLNTTQRLFAGVRLVRMLDTGVEKDKAGRFDFSLGLSL
ncbi:hypothetical protein [Flavihumibacter sp. UBA7668]|uniref:hypothetical protein n=1 Tax=Flavihumibacter sp. UBA7668 TaxID=1946542 RepID=UPI0025BA6A5A|nr:hypothetical protein [Flavihumibacter sp. UBA7668]